MADVALRTKDVAFAPLLMLCFLSLCTVYSIAFALAVMLNNESGELLPRAVQPAAAESLLLILRGGASTQ